MIFPEYRPRRMRAHENLRRMVRETRLSVDNLIYPLFAIGGKNVREPIAAMPGQFRLSIDELLKEAKDVAGLGIVHEVRDDAQRRAQGDGGTGDGG